MALKKQEDLTTLEGVLESSWRLLHDGVRNYRNPFHHPVFGTVAKGRAEVRAVILREFSEKDRVLVFHCDARSPKVSQIRANPGVSWLFYDPKKWLQIRLSGMASVHTEDQVAGSQWEKIDLHHRINYLAEAPPGSPVDRPSSGLSDFVRDKAPALLDGARARRNFAAVVCRFDEMDWLLLKITGHMRARFLWKGDDIEASWIIP